MSYNDHRFRHGLFSAAYRGMIAIFFSTIKYHIIPMRFFTAGIVCLVLVSLFFSMASSAEPVSIENPQGALSVEVFADDANRLSFSIFTNTGEPLVQPSPLGIVVDGADLGASVDIQAPEVRRITETFPTRLNHTTGSIDCNRAEIGILHRETATAYQLVIMSCKTGAAYRYVIPGAGKRTVSAESGAWKIPPGATFWYQTSTTSYESEYVKAQEIQAEMDLGPPLVIEYENGAYAAITEAALFNYSGMTLKADSDNVFRAAFLDDPSGWELEGEIVTPWRVLLFATDLNGLVNSDLIEGLAGPPQVDPDAEWIRPGRTLWSWLNGAVESVTPENMRHYIDMAADLGFEYVLVDAGWEATPEYWRNPPGWGDAEKSSFEYLAELVAYAAEKNVGIWAWKHYLKLTDPEYRRDYMQRMAAMGVDGLKIDFMDSESLEMVRFYEDCLRDAAANKLMINFHGANKPTGESRVWPNEMTREGIRGLEMKNLSPTHTTALPFTRGLAGHADFTAMHFKEEWMSLTTWPHQLASGIIFTSPVTFFGGHPQDYLDSPAADLIRAIPPVWDETVVLDKSKIGRVAAFARRAGDTWFVAVMNAGGSMKFDLALNFLEPGAYRVTAYLDDRTNLSMKTARAKVSPGDTLPVRMKSLGGFAAVIRPESDDSE